MIRAFKPLKISRHLVLCRFDSGSGTIKTMG